MSVNDHLSDEQIQLYLDSTAKSDSSEIQVHLDSCESCRKTYLQYQLLTRVASQPISINLSPDFATCVAAVVSSSSVADEQETLQSQISNWLVPLVASLGAILVWAYFAGWNHFWNTALSGFLRGYHSVTEPLSGLSESFSFVGDSTGLILAAGLLILFFGSMDKIIRTLSKARHINISFI